MKKTTIYALSLAALLICANSLAAPVSTYYMSAGDSATLVRIQGTGYDSFSTMSNEYAMAVRDGHIRATNTHGLSGFEYTTGGTPTGSVFSHSGPIRTFDGTTDGDFNYGIQFDTGTVYRYGLDWSDATELFGTTSRSLGITYDTVSDTLWTTEWENATLYNWALDGTLLGTYATAVDEATGLAFDYADGTLWFGTQNDLHSTSRTLYNYSTSGVLLGTEVYTGYIGEQNYLGGEFEFQSSSAPVPEPSTITLLGLGLAGLARRSRKTRA